MPRASRGVGISPGRNVLSDLQLHVLPSRALEIAERADVLRIRAPPSLAPGGSTRLKNGPADPSSFVVKASDLHPFFIVRFEINIRTFFY